MARLTEEKYGSPILVSSKEVALKHNKVQLWKDGPYWAETNIGAENPWDSGYYFWWGDTVGYKYESNIWVASDGSSSSFQFSKDNPICQQTYKKHNSTLLSEGRITANCVLAPEYDAAQVQWGGRWRMPTKQELDDLCDKCDWIWTTVNGVSGYVAHGRDGYRSANIFFPTAGLGCGSSLNDAGSLGSYWSSFSDEMDNYGSWRLYFRSHVHETSDHYRNYGFSVRPVQGIT